MNGRYFGGRQILASLMIKKETFRQSSQRMSEEEEKLRLKSFEDWIDEQQ